MSRPPDWLADAWGEIQLGRDRLGLPRLAWDDRLHRAAQASCDDRASLPEEDHHRLRRRLAAAGWPSREGPGEGPPLARVPANFGEMEAGESPFPRTPEGHARFWIQHLGGPPGDHAHRDDFRDCWTHGGIGASADGRLFVLVYGCPR